MNLKSCEVSIVCVINYFQREIEKLHNQQLLCTYWGHQVFPASEKLTMNKTFNSLP